MTHLNREQYVPSGATKIVPKDANVEFYLYQGPRGPSAMAFIGKARKPSWRFYFLSEADREKRILNTIEGVKASAAIKAKWKAERQKPHTLKLGDILYSSWGYDQTNIDFYEVTALIGKSMVELRQLCVDTTETGFMSGSTTPRLGVYRDETRLRRKVSGNNSVSIESYAGAYPWDGKPKSCSWYA